jgi:hypothetical protein
MCSTLLFLLFELELLEVAPTETVVDNLGAENIYNI